MKQITIEDALELSENALFEKTCSWRWGTAVTYVVNIDGLLYQYTIRYHSEHGAFDSNDDMVVLRLVEPYSEVVTKYRLVSSTGVAPVAPTAPETISP